MNQEFVLEGLFTHLVREGFGLSIRDYHDALRALRAGYGAGSRQNLLWLCQTLWARTNEEARLLNLLFRSFPFPSDEELRELGGEGGAPQAAGDADADKPGAPGGGAGARDERGRRPAEEPQLPAIQFSPPAQKKGIGLERALVEPARGEVFILTPRPPVPLRALIIIWRRFRAAKREGPKVELDLDATVREQCRVGFLTAPVLVPARRNQARLVVLIDVSDSMLPWRDFHATVVDSLLKGHLGRAAVYYFHNAVDDTLYERPTLTRPVRVERALKEHPNSTLMIFSDAGAARGFQRRGRFEETKEFLARVWPEWRPIVWMNPMPPHRWTNSPAGKISRLWNVRMLQLSEEGLVRAIDVLRGKPH